jgi:hypothetical protein
MLASSPRLHLDILRTSGGSFIPVAVHSAELLIDCEEDRVLRAVLVGMLRETDR